METVLTGRKPGEALSQERRALLLFIETVCLLFLGAVTLADPDLWGHTYYGLRALDLGVLAEPTDPFSYTAPGASWINHEWLTELTLAGCWRAGGSPALVLWRNFWLLILFWLVDRLLRTDVVRLSAAWMLLFFNTAALANFVIFVRPQLVTYVGFVMTLTLLRQSWETPTRWCWCLPPLMMLWTNFHGGFLAGVALTWLFALAATLRWVGDQQRTDLKHWWGLATAVALATFVNPYGPRLHGMLWEHLVTRQLIAEWQPLWSLTPSVVYFVPYGLTFLALGWSRCWKWIDALVLVIVGWQAASHLRHLALFCLATVVLLPLPLSHALEQLFPSLHARWSTPERAWWRWTSACGLAFFWIFLHLHGTWPIIQDGIRPWDVAVETRSNVPGMPVAAVTAMRQAGLQGNLVTDYAWGQFVIWWLWPEMKVAYDGRYRTVYPQAIEQAYVDLTQAGDHGRTTTPLLDAFPTTHVLAPLRTGMERTLRKRTDWQAVYEDEQCVLFARRQQKLAGPDPSPPNLLTLSDPQFPRWVRFPGINALND